MHAPMPNAQQAICSVLDDMMAETVVRLEADLAHLEALRQHLETYKEHLRKVVFDFVERNATIHRALEDIETRSVLAARAVYAAPLIPPALPPELAERAPDIAGALAQVRALGGNEPTADD